MEYKSPSGTTVYPAIACNLHFDDEKQDKELWPRTLSCKPELGEIVRGLNGRRGVVKSVQHSFYSATTIEDGKKHKIQHPCLIIKLKVTNPGSD